MKKLTVFLCTIVLVFGVVEVSNATLWDRGGGLIYDDVLDITWLQDANYAFSVGGAAYDEITWYEATTWAENLVYYDNVRNVSWDDWRLPQTLPVDGTSYDYTWSANGYTDRGYNISAPDSAYPGSIGSEMAFMYYVNLGNLGHYDVNGNVPQPGWGLGNKGPFINLNSRYFWSGTEYAADTDRAWGFFFGHGEQYSHDKDDLLFDAWAVRDGDVVPVPEPPDPVDIDIMPRTCPNECPIKGGGSIEVAILGTLAFDVTDIDIASVRLEGVAPIRSRLKDKSSPVVPPPTECECTTEGRDGFIDLCLKFDKKEILSALGEVDVGDSFVLTLTGSLNDGTPVEGRDCIVMTQKGKKN